jgi:glycosyltransferase involved in cell wall biosynthesis
MEGAKMDALVVSYTFPPTGGAGVARVLKLVKYLPAHGITPSVLTAANPSVPLLDRSRERDVAPELEIVRARTFEPGYAAKQAVAAADTNGHRPGLVARAKRLAVRTARAALVPDAQILWQPGAYAALARRLAAPGKRPDVVCISGPPFSQFLLAPLARLAPGTAVVLDYRDEWSTWRTTYENSSRAAALVGAPLERALLHMAHAVTTATEAFRQNLLAQFPFLDPGRVRAIPNGFDPDDYPAELPAPPTDRFVITYAGTIFKLTSARGLLGAVRRLHRDAPELAKYLNVRFLGRIVDAELDAFEGSEALGVERLGYVEHARVTSELAASHLVLCLLDDVPGAERIYPAKIFELMHLGRPTLTLAPPGELADLVRSQRMGDLVAPRDEAAIASVLERHLRAFVAGEPPAPMRALDAARYHRRALAGEFAEVFRQASARARS